MLVTRLSGGAELKHWFDEGRGGYLYIIDGAAAVAGLALSAREGAKIEGPEDVGRPRRRPN